MRILALDTSTRVAAVAVVIDGRVAAENDDPPGDAGPRHGEVLLGRVESSLTSAGLAIGDLDLVAVGIGPGSFTGLRVGVAMAKGLCLATGLPLRGVVSLRALARGLDVGAESAWAAPVVDAHRGEVFVAAWPRVGAGPELGAGVEPFHAPPDEAGRRLRAAVGEVELVLCGDGLRRHGDAFTEALGAPHRVAPEERDVPRPGLLALEAAEAFAREGPSDLDTLEPLYLRPSDAKLPGTPLKTGR